MRYRRPNISARIEEDKAYTGPVRRYIPPTEANELRELHTPPGIVDFGVNRGAMLVPVHAVSAVGPAQHASTEVAFEVPLIGGDVVPLVVLILVRDHSHPELDVTVDVGRHRRFRRAKIGPRVAAWRSELDRCHCYLRAASAEHQPQHHQAHDRCRGQEWTILVQPPVCSLTLLGTTRQALVHHHRPL